MENKQTHAAEQLVTDMHSTEIKELKQPKKGFNYWYIGQRIRDATDLQFKATIRYIGPVATSEKKDTTWIGMPMFCRNTNLCSLPLFFFPKK